MGDNTVVRSALDLTTRAIEKAKSNREACEEEIDVALGALRYVERAFWRESELKGTQFALVDPSNHIDALRDATLPRSDFETKAQQVLDAVEVLRSISAE